LQRDRVEVVLFLLVALLLLAGCGSAGRAAPAVPLGFADGNVGPGVSEARVIVEPDDGARPLTRLIDRAQQQIFVTAYILTDVRIVHALERAAAQGVRVWVMLEPHPLGMGTQPERLASQLRASGIYFRWTRPGFALTHAKYMVLDDSQAVISTANFSRSAVSHNREFLVVDTDAADVRAVSSVFRADWNRVPARVRAPDVVLAPETARKKIETIAGRAKRHLLVYGEEIADPRFERLLAGARSRGVDVRVMLPSGASPAAAAWLRGRGIRVRQPSVPYIHAKYLSVDGRLAYVGSENFSEASLDRNREVGVVLRGGLVRRLDRVFVGDWAR